MNFSPAPPARRGLRIWSWRACATRAWAGTRTPCACYPSAWSARRYRTRFLNAGYASAKLGRAEEAARYWSLYPSWAGQRKVESTLKEQVRLIRAGGADLDAACEAVAVAVFEQDKVNARDWNFREAGRRTSEFRQGY